MERMAEGRRDDLREGGAECTGRIRHAARSHLKLGAVGTGEMAEFMNHGALLRHDQQQQKPEGFAQMFHPTRKTNRTRIVLHAPQGGFSGVYPGFACARIAVSRFHVPTVAKIVQSFKRGGGCRCQVSVLDEMRLAFLEESAHTFDALVGVQAHLLRTDGRNDRMSEATQPLDQGIHEPAHVKMRPLARLVRLEVDRVKIHSVAEDIAAAGDDHGARTTVAFLYLIERKVHRADDGDVDGIAGRRALDTERGNTFGDGD